MNHLSCFSGIGGIDIAAEWAGFRTVGQIEKDPYSRKILSKHWPDIPRWGDIRDVSGADLLRECGQITLVSGGFPCQPHSVAGKRRGSSDERDLWPELCRIIRETEPRWFVGENVPGLLSSDSGSFFAGVLRDLAEMGYNVGWCSYEAARVGAPHRRERVFIVAYSNSCGCLHGESKELPTEGRIQTLSELKSGCQDVAYSGHINVQGELQGFTHSEGREKQGNGQAGPCSNGFGWWAIKPGLGRVADGIPSRVDRLRCLGNAVVPQQIYPLFRAIAKVEEMVQ